MGMDGDAVRALSGIRGVDSWLRRIFGRLLRRQALRAQGRLVGHGRPARAPELPQLVPGPLPVRLRQVPLRRHAPDRRNPMRILALLVLAGLALGPLPVWAQTVNKT